MNFLARLFKSGIGAAFGVIVFAVVASLIFRHQLPSLDGLGEFIMVVAGAFAVVNAIAHLGSNGPSFPRSLIASLIIAVLFMAISLWAGAFAGWEVAAVTAFSVMFFVAGVFGHLIDRMGGN